VELHVILTAKLNLFFFSLNISQIVVKIYQKSGGTFQTHQRKTRYLSRCLSILFALVSYLMKQLTQFRTVDSTLLAFDKDNKRLLSIFHRRCYTTEDLVKCFLSY